MVLFSEMRIPVLPKPIVESTEITDDPTETCSVHLVFGVTMNFPCIVDDSSYPTNRDNL